MTKNQRPETRGTGRPQENAPRSPERGGARSANQDIWSGRWKQIRGKIRHAWGQLTDDELDKASGRRDQLIGRIQEKTGEAREEVERLIDRFESELSRD